MNIHICRKRLKNAKTKERDLKKLLNKTKISQKITRGKLQRQLTNLKKGEENLRKTINKIRAKKK